MSHDELVILFYFIHNFLYIYNKI